MELIIGKIEKILDYYAKKTTGNYFGFELMPPASYVTFNELNRFRWESKKLTRFKNRYEGNVIIDLTAWNDGNFTCHEFEAFMYYLKDNPGYVCTFASEKNLDPLLLKRLEGLFGEINQISFLTPQNNAKKRNIGFTIDNKEENDVREQI